MNDVLGVKDISDEWVNNVLARTNDMCQQLTKIVHTLIDNTDTTKLCPPLNKVLNFARWTTFDKIRVVILGQDPYPNCEDACGLAFSGGTPKVPKSLSIIFKALISAGLIKSKKPYGNLQNWARQGVLLLNCAWTTMEGESKAHTLLWEKYVNDVIMYLCDYFRYKKKRQLIFMLWGNDAKSKSKFINPNGNYHIILTSPHPMAGVYSSSLQFTANNFVEANYYLVNEFKEIPINWDPNEVALEIPLTLTKERHEIITLADLKFEKYKYIAFSDGSAIKNGKEDCEAAFAIAIINNNNSETPSLEKKTTIIGKLDIAVDENGTIIYPSNIRAEGFGILKYMEKLQTEEKDCKVLMAVDTKFWIDMLFNYMPLWERKGTNFQDKENADLTMKMWKIFKEICDNNVIIDFIHVPSHDKFKWSKSANKYCVFLAAGNGYVDDIASAARVSLKPNEVKETTEEIVFS